MMNSMGMGMGMGMGMSVGMNAGLPSVTDALRNGESVPTISKNLPMSKLRARAKDLEGFFLSQVLDSMFKGIKTSGPFNGGNGEKIYRQLEMQQYGKIIAQHGGIGLANEIVRQVVQQQEIDRKPGQGAAK